MQLFGLSAQFVAMQYVIFIVSNTKLVRCHVDVGHIQVLTMILAVHVNRLYFTLNYLLFVCFFFFVCLFLSFTFLPFFFLSLLFSFFFLFLLSFFLSLFLSFFLSFFILSSFLRSCFSPSFMLSFFHVLFLSHLLSFFLRSSFLSFRHPFCLSFHYLPFYLSFCLSCLMNQQHTIQNQKEPREQRLCATRNR